MEYGNEEFTLELISFNAKPLANKEGKYCYEMIDYKNIKEKMLECIQKIKNK